MAVRRKRPGLPGRPAAHPATPGLQLAGATSGADTELGPGAPAGRSAANRRDVYERLESHNFRRSVRSHPDPQRATLLELGMGAHRAERIASGNQDWLTKHADPAGLCA